MTAQDRIVRYVFGRKTPATRKEIARATRIPENTVNWRVAELIEFGVFDKYGQRGRYGTVGPSVGDL